jgi:peroxiredoxin
MGLLRTAVFVFCSFVPALAWAQGSTAPAISLRDTTGQTQTIQNFAGKPAVIHFWATWCSACLTELPQLIDTANEMQTQGLSFILIAGDSHAATRDYLHAQALDAEVLIDQYGKAMREYQIQALPTSVFIDVNGNITETRRGRLDWESPTLRSKLRSLLVE